MGVRHVEVWGPLSGISDRVQVGHSLEGGPGTCIYSTMGTMCEEDDSL